MWRRDGYQAMAGCGGAQGKLARGNVRGQDRCASSGKPEWCTGWLANGAHHEGGRGVASWGVEVTIGAFLIILGYLEFERELLESKTPIWQV